MVAMTAVTRAGRRGRGQNGFNPDRARVDGRGARKSCPDRATQFHPRHPVVTYGFKVALIGVVFLLLGQQQFERANQHVVEPFNLARHDRFALRNERGPVLLDDPALRIDPFNPQPDVVVDFQFPQCQRALGHLPLRLRTRDRCLALVEER